MTEPEVSLYLAIYHIKNHLTDQDIKVSIDGAHIKTGNIVHFDIEKFFREHHFVKKDGDFDRWQGRYCIEGQSADIILESVPGYGDVQIILQDGKTLLVESKKSKEGKGSQEYPLMREAIGQLMTSCLINENTIPAVAIPYTKKSLELAERWSQLEQIRKVGIRFILVQENGDIVMI
uniref:Uncharacterized protein n=1 Tax=Eubacterium plexicaudatum ASF492 TaxID=1235802 RepID=N2BDL3_9FIRM